RELAAPGLVAQHLGATGVAEVTLAELGSHAAAYQTGAPGLKRPPASRKWPARHLRQRPRHGHGELGPGLPVLAADEPEGSERPGAERARDGGELPDLLAVDDQRRAGHGRRAGEPQRHPAAVHV